MHTTIWILVWDPTNCCTHACVPIATLVLRIIWEIRGELDQSLPLAAASTAQLVANHNYSFLHRNLESKLEVVHLFEPW